MPGSWSDYLELRKGDAPPHSNEDGDVRVYADSGGALRSVQSDGTDAPVGGGGSQTVLVHTATLTHAQILALPSTPDGGIEIVPAPGAGKAIDVLRVALFTNITEEAQQYTNISATAYFHLSLRSEDGSLDLAITANEGTFFGNDFVTGLLNQPGTGGNQFVMGPGYDVGTASQGNQPTVEAAGRNVDNAAVRLGCSNPGSGNFADGDPQNVLTAQTLYWVYDLPT